MGFDGVLPQVPRPQTRPDALAFNRRVSLSKPIIDQQQMATQTSNAAQTPSTSNSKDQQTLTLNQEQIDALGVLVRAVQIAARRGGLELNEASIIYDAVKKFAVQEGDELVQKNK